ncbi:MAG: hypothetical protein ACE5JL_07910, partial [Dehalococcoidia bacterium]
PKAMGTALGGESVLPPFPLVQRLELLLFIAGFLCVLVALVKRWRVELDRRRYGLLLLWILLPFLIFPHKKIGLTWYYFDVLYPSQFLVIGVLCSSLVTRFGLGKRRRFPSRWIVGMIFFAVIAIVASQTFFLARLQRAILDTGVIRLPTSYNLRFPDPWWSLKETGFAEMMPVKYKKVLTEKLIAKLGADRRTFEQNIHGSSFQDLRQDKGYFFTALSEAAGPAAHPGSDLHSLILRDDLYRDAVVTGKTTKIGPFRIVTYRPVIRYGAWKYSPTATEGWRTDTFDDSGWLSVDIPARNLPDLSVYNVTPFYTWQGSSVHLRGWLHSPPEDRLQVVVSIRDDFASLHRVDAFFVNGQKVEVERTKVYNTVLARSYEALFDVTDTLKEGANLIALQISGTTPAFDLDIYELLLEGQR